MLVYLNIEHLARALFIKAIFFHLDSASNHYNNLITNIPKKKKPPLSNEEP